MKLFRKWAIVLGLSGIAAGTTAAPLYYDEASQGDIDFPSPVFSLDSGVNVIEGTLQSQVVIGSSDPNLPLGGLYDYSFTAVVTSVPEPGTLALVLVGPPQFSHGDASCGRSEKT